MCWYNILLVDELDDLAGRLKLFEQIDLVHDECQVLLVEILQIDFLERIRAHIVVGNAMEDLAEATRSDRLHNLIQCASHFAHLNLLELKPHKK